MPEEQSKFSGVLAKLKQRPTAEQSTAQPAPPVNNGPAAQTHQENSNPPVGRYQRRAGSLRPHRAAFDGVDTAARMNSYVQKCENAK